MWLFKMYIENLISTIDATLTDTDAHVKYWGREFTSYQHAHSGTLGSATFSHRHLNGLNLKQI